ncbi:MAG TPA: TfoX/Sxy family protein [Rhizobacter sp.]|nr:TfoX/Sxy family protein [Rhizobacter sp.]
MTLNSEFAAHCLELLSPLGPTRSRRMFGGHGFYVDDIFIALAAADRLYLKADAQTQARFEAAGCEPFAYDAGDNKRVTLGYWTAPEDAMESPMLMLPWARLAMEAALRARNAKPARKRKPAVQARGGTKS